MYSLVPETYSVCIAMDQNFFGFRKELKITSSFFLFQTISSFLESNQIATEFTEPPFLQQFAVEIFQKMKVPQVLPPDVAKVEDDASYKQKVALIGCGPASIGCATFLARMGYNDVTIYEKEEFVGGLNSSELPAYRYLFKAKLSPETNFFKWNFSKSTFPAF